MSPFRVRWLGRVDYRDADAVQHAWNTRSTDDALLLLEHPHVYTLGRRASRDHVLVDPHSVGAALIETDRGGDVTYHGPGQLVGYPIVTLPAWRDGAVDVVRYVRTLESTLIAVLNAFGIDAFAVAGYTGVWTGDVHEPDRAEKIAAIGVKVTHGRALHGFALNVDPDLGMFEHIVPCGIRDRGVTSMSRALGRPVDMRVVVDQVIEEFTKRFAQGRTIERQDAPWRTTPLDLAPFSRGVAADPAVSAAAVEERPVRLLGRLASAGVPLADVEDRTKRRPEWMRVKADLGGGYRATKQLVDQLNLHTVCEEAGCPNIYECWADRTATFMILGERCTRACGFCLVDTRKPNAVDLDEPNRVARAVEQLGLAHAVITSVARDDLADGGALAFAATIEAIRRRSPETTVEVLIPDCKGDPASLDVIFDARPDVLNHNLETVLRLQRAARPSASYLRSLAVLARAAAHGLPTKSGLIVGLGEEVGEVRGAILDLRAVGVELLTIGQYLSPSAQHLPVARWWTPEELADLGTWARELGFRHVESGPLVRSSYHARTAAVLTGRSQR